GKNEETKMVYKSFFCAVFTVFISTPAALATTLATTYDLVSDWQNNSTNSNPNGPWSYRQLYSPLPYQTSICCGVGPSGFAPGTLPGNFLPAFWQSGGPGSDISVHSVDAHNGFPSAGNATLVWTAPVAGTIDISGYFYAGQPDLHRINFIELFRSGVLGQL